MRAFAKLLGKGDAVHYITSESVTLGRQRPSSSSGRADIPLSSSRCISRIHAKITWNRQKQMFELHCCSGNGAFVDGAFVHQGDAPVALSSRTLIQIGDNLFYFLLPKDQEGELESSDLDSDEASDKRKRVPGSAPMGINVKQAKVSSGKRWNRTARERLRKAIMRYGFGRWDKLEEAIDDLEYSRQNVQVYSSQFVYQLKVHCHDSALIKGLSEVLAVSPHKGIAVEEPDPSLSNWSSLQKNVKKWGNRIVLLHELKMAIEKFGEKHLLEKVGAIKGRSMGPHWGRAEDQSLCLGTFHHGFGEFEALRTDVSLGFKNKWIVKNEEDSTGPGVNVDIGDDDANPKMADDEEDIPGDGAGGGSNVIAGSDTGASAVKTETPAAAEASGLPIWPQHLALIGRLKRILDALRVKSSRTPSGSSRRKKKPTPAVNSVRSAALSAVRSVTSRAKKGKRPSAATIAPPEDPEPKASPSVREIARVKKMKEKAGQWTRREQATFQKAMLAQGKPDDWEVFRRAWTGLEYKSNDILDKYYNRFMWAVRRASDDTSVIDGTEPDEGSEANPVEVTKATAVRVRERMDLFAKMKEAVAHEDFDDRIACAQQSYDLPSWWNADTDASLLRGLPQYGLGNWGKFISDPELPGFYSMLTMSELPDNRVVIKRIKHLLTVFLPSFDRIQGRKKSSRKRSFRLSIKGKRKAPSKTKSSPVQSGADPGTAASSPASETASAVKRRKKVAQLDLVKYDEDSQPIMPLVLSPSLKILNLGSISDKPKYHDSRHVYPIGFRSWRLYSSITKPRGRSEYVSEIVEGEAGNGPVFRVTCKDLPDEVFEKSTMTAVWRAVETRVDEHRGVLSRKTSSVRGGDKFGIDDATVRSLIVKLPGIEKCTQFVHKDELSTIGDGDSGVSSPAVAAADTAVAAEASSSAAAATEIEPPKSSVLIGSMEGSAFTRRGSSIVASTGPLQRQAPQSHVADSDMDIIEEEPAESSKEAPGMDEDVEDEEEEENAEEEDEEDEEEDEDAADVSSVKDTINADNIMEVEDMLTESDQSDEHVHEERSDDEHVQNNGVAVDEEDDEEEIDEEEEEQDDDEDEVEADADAEEEDISSSDDEDSDDNMEGVDEEDVEAEDDEADDDGNQEDIIDTDDDDA